MSDRAITGRDIIGETVVERKIVPAPLRRERLPPVGAGTDPLLAIQAMHQAFYRFQQSVDDATRNARTVPMFAQGGHMTEPVTFTSGTPKVVSHPLGRPFQGAMFEIARVASAAGYIVDNDTDSVVRDELNKVQITIHPTASFTGRLWIY